MNQGMHYRLRWSVQICMHELCLSDLIIIDYVLSGDSVKWED